MSPSSLIRHALRELYAIRREVMGIRAYDRRQPHCFVEDKSDRCARIRKLELLLIQHDVAPSRSAHVSAAERVFKRA